MHHYDVYFLRLLEQLRYHVDIAANRLQNVSCSFHSQKSNQDFEGLPVHPFELKQLRNDPRHLN